MTKPGYTHIIVPVDLHQKLKDLADQNNVSMSQLIAQLVHINVNVNVGVSINTLNAGINTQQPTPQLSQPQTLPKSNLKQAPFPKSNEGSAETVGFRMVGPGRFELPSQAPKA